MSASESLSIMTDVFRPIVGDMVSISPRHWVKDLSEDVRATLDLDPYKAATYEFHYGISCAWVPRLEAGKFVWRRTVKQTRRCLWISHFTVDAPDRTAISVLYGTEVLRREAEAALDALVPRAESFWASVASPQGVLTEAQRQEAQTGTYRVIHHPPPALVTAFTLARLGQGDAARSHLREKVRLREGPILDSGLARLEELIASY